MNVSTAIETRRSVKVFDPLHRMSEAETERLMELAMLTPTAFNIQHWRFVLAQDPALRQELRAVSWNQAQVTDASLLVIVCADVHAWEKQPERYWRHAPPEIQARIVQGLVGYYRGNEPVQRDEALRSSSMAAMTLMLAAKEMGYESCPMDGFDFDAVARLINLPEDHLICMFVAIGKPKRDPTPRGGQLPLDEVVIRDRFK